MYSAFLYFAFIFFLVIKDIEEKEEIVAVVISHSFNKKFKDLDSSDQMVIFFPNSHVIF